MNVNKHEDRDGGGNGDENREEGGRQREPGDGYGSKYVRDGPTSTNNQRPQLQHPTPQGDRRIMRRTKAQ